MKYDSLSRDFLKLLAIINPKFTAKDLARYLNDGVLSL